MVRVKICYPPTPKKQENRCWIWFYAFIIVYNGDLVTRQMAQTVGEQLKQARLKRDLTLEQVSRAIHIRTHYLEALENDQRDALPSKVQGRGFLRLYADHLDLPVKPLLDAWDGIIPVEEAVVSSPDEVEAPAAAPLVEEPESSIPAPLPETNFPQAYDDVFESDGQLTGPVPVEYQAPVAAVETSNGSAAVFKEIGEKLRQQREALGLSLPEVEQYTRLRQHYIQALEEGRIEGLPSPVQGRGMLSNYAAFLNLDEDKLLLRFAEGLQLRRVERIPPPEPQPVINKKKTAKPVSPLRRLLTPDLIFGAIVVSAILFFAIRTAASISTLSEEEAQPTTQAISEILLTTPTAAIPTDTLPAGASNSLAATIMAGNSSGESVDIESVPYDPSDTDGFTTNEPEEGSSTEGTPAATIQAINNDPLQIYIIARQRAFLRINVDGKVEFNGRVIPGNAYAFSGTKSIELLTGNASALQVFFNQEDLGTLGLAGQVVGLVFSPEGMMTPTPMPTFTPTITPLVTQTPSPTATITATSPATPTITPLIP